MPSVTEFVLGTTIAFSFILFGNAITQSIMGVPALLVDFPPPSSPEHAARARLLGRQWPVFWVVGNNFFRPISTLGVFGYAYAAWAAASSSQESARLGDWRVYALSSLCHLITVVHSAVNMQPINEKLDALAVAAGEQKEGKIISGGVDVALAETYARRWIQFNTVRMITPVVAGSLVLWQVLR
ncbi:hypothetical protein F5Y16DRAFT_395277 [Xylariaceae sp. FL0255]|nr:hypothetical protein F5Y16DRAFT_395277 [Xylariaceae sp. FL0255]